MRAATSLFFASSLICCSQGSTTKGAGAPIVEPAVLIDASPATAGDIEPVDPTTLCYRETGSADGEEGEVNAHNEALGGLRRTSSQEDVLAALGKPEKVAGPEEEMATGDILWTWDYPSKGISISMAESSGPSALRLSSMSMQAPSRLKTKLGIGIGSPLREVLTIYKDCIADVSMNYDEETQLLVGSPYDGLWIAGTKGGNVTSLGLGGAE